MSGFHEVSFPARLAFGSGSGIERRTDIVTLGSGFERRISPWALGRRRYLIGAGIKSLTDAVELLGFFEAREGRLYGFRFRDFADFRSCALSAEPGPLDQPAVEVSATTFQLQKMYGAVARPVVKPVAGRVRVAVGGVEVLSGWTVDVTTGVVTFEVAPEGDVTAGFAFDTPVRFDGDRIDVTLEGFDAGRVAAVSLVEVRGRGVRSEGGTFFFYG